LTKIQSNISKYALKLTYTNVEFLKTDIPDLRFKGEKGMEGAAGEWQREKEGGRKVEGNWNRPPTNFGLKLALCKPVVLISTEENTCRILFRGN